MIERAAESFDLARANRKRLHDAGVVLVRGRLDQDVSATRRVEVVIREGRVLDRDRLEFDPATDPGFREALPVSSHP